MTVLDGFLSRGGLYATVQPGGLSTGLHLLTETPGWYGRIHGNPTAVGVGPHNDRFQQTATPRSLPGFLSTTYGVDFFNRIHIKPSALAVGNLTSVQSREVKVWNAFFTPKALDNITPSGDVTGISISGATPPRVFGGTEEVTFTVVVDTAGATTIDAAYTFNFTGANSPILPITGNRAILWPFTPRVEYSESLEWATDIIDTFNKEQRIALRTAPRQSFAYRHPLSAAEFSKAKAIATGWTFRVFGVPVWNERQRIAGLSAGATVIPVDTTAADYRAGGLAAIWINNNDVTGVEIDTVAAGSITLKLPLARSYSNVIVAPVRFCRAFSGFDFSRITGRFTDLSQEFQANDNVDLGYDPSETHRDYPVLEYCPLIVSPLSERIARDLDIFDNQSGLVEVDTVNSWVRRRYTIAMLRANKADTWAMRRWLHSRRGRQKAFWLPSFNDDLILAQTTGLNPSTLTVKPFGAVQFYDGKLDLRIVLNDGRRFFAQVITATVDSNGNEQLGLGSALISPPISPSDVKQIAIMSLVRFDADKITINYDSAGFASMTVSAIEVPDL